MTDIVHSDPMIDLRSIAVDYGSTRILNDFDLQVNKGELVALLGPSGSGKTTALRTIGGFIHPSAGDVFIHGMDVTTLPPEKRGVGIVFQSYALFPHMTVYENIEYSLRVRGVTRPERRQKAQTVLELVRLNGQGSKKPARLSGGQQQRVALARALAMEPEVLLLDEPLSNLDANLRKDVGEEIRRLQVQQGLTALMVTHDRQEAFGMADRIAVLRDGKIEQLGTPAELYRRPHSTFIAGFVGQANLLPAIVRRLGNGEAEVEIFGSTATVPTTNADFTEGQEADLLVRPETLTLGPADSHIVIDAEVLESFYYGANSHVRIVASGIELAMMVPGWEIRSAGDYIRVGFDPKHAALVPVPGATHA